jgi:uncharacterized membrane protein YgdD (TMEM256/DUF423 family)
MNIRTSLLWGATMGGLAVAIGAFGAHALKPILEASGRAETFELAVRYQFYHALALLATGVIMNQVESKLLHYCGLFFVLGIVFFCGSLYALCLSGLRILGAVTPIGGVFFILGWIFLFLGMHKKQKPQF